MKFSWSSQKRPIIALAPMANITTLPFRSICREMGADITYTPMLSSNAIIHNPEKTLNIASFLESEQPVIVQIFGYSGDLIAKAANIAQNGLKCAGIDINMGCPAPKITGNECGSALLRDLNKSTKIIEKIRDKYNGQLSVKLRLGWDKFEVLDFVQGLEKIGIDAVTVHGRTAKQGYRGDANWKAINEIADSVQIPVIGNGDINTWKIAYQRLKNTSLAGVMIGRASLGNPWIFREIKDRKSSVIYCNELIRVINLQAKRYVDFIGEKQAMIELRKHLGWYIRGFDGAPEIRKRAVLINSYNDLTEILTMLESIHNARTSTN